MAQGKDMGPPPGGSRVSRAQLIANALYGFGGYVLYLPVSLVVNAFVVHRIGISAYGIWATLTTMVGYGALLDLGVSTPLIKYVADATGRNRADEVNDLLATAMVVYFAAGMLFALVVTLASGWILGHLFHTGAHDQTMRLLLLAVAYGFAVSLTFDVLESLIAGLQRVDLNARLTLLYNFLNAAGVVVVLALGYGVNGLVLVWIVLVGVTAAGNWVVARRLFPALVLNPFRFSRSQLRRILRFSAKVQISTVSTTMNDQVDPTLIAYALGPAYLGSYQLGARAAQAVRGVGYSVMSSILPAASNLSALGQDEALRLLFLRSTRYLAIVELGLCAGVGSLAYPLVWLWLGPGHERVAATVMILLTIYAIRLPALGLSSVLNGIGRPDIRMRADTVFLFIHIPLSVTLIWRFGFYGTLVGSGLAFVVTRAYVAVAGSAALGVSLRQLGRVSLLQPTIGAMIAIVVAVAMQHSGHSFSILRLVVEVVAFGAVYGGYIALFGLDRYDRDIIKTHLVEPIRTRATRLRPETS